MRVSKPNFVEWGYPVPAVATGDHDLFGTAEDKRFVLDSFGLSLQEVERQVIATLGSDVTEQACETGCPAVINAIPGGSFVSGYLCPQACKSIQNAAKGKKRFVLDSFGISLQEVERQVIATLGSDVTEQACEAGCPAVINAIPGGSFVSGYLCPQACKSIQNAANGKRRFVLDSFGISLQEVERQVIATLGSDVTEQACETGCPAVINAIPGGSFVSGYLCPQACKSIQNAAKGRRFVLDSFGLSLQEVERQVIATLGSDVTEQACEAGCPAVINAIPGGSFVSGYLCPQACKSIQNAAKGKKRFVLDSFGISLQEVERQVIATLGSDVTEQACETGCPAVINAIPGGSLVSGYLCPQACKSIQNAAKGRRFVLDSFGLSLQEVERQVIAALGSDVTEHACEAGCPAVINAIPGGSFVSGYLCPQACKSIQNAAQGRKRNILDSLEQSLKEVENQLKMVLESGATEQECESDCPTLIGDLPGGSFIAPVFCPQACKRFQSV